METGDSIAASGIRGGGAERGVDWAGMEEVDEAEPRRGGDWEAML